MNSDSWNIHIFYSRRTVAFGSLCTIGLISTVKLKPSLLNKCMSRIFAAFYTTALIQIVHGRQVQFLWRLLLRVAVQVPDDVASRDKHPKHKTCSEHMSMLQRHNQHQSPTLKPKIYVSINYVWHKNKRVRGPPKIWAWLTNSIRKRHFYHRKRNLM